MKAYAQKTIRFDMEDAERIQEIAKGSKVSFNTIVTTALKAFLVKNKNMFPLKEDPVAEKKTERNNSLSLYSDHEETKW